MANAINFIRFLKSGRAVQSACRNLQHMCTEPTPKRNSLNVLKCTALRSTTTRYPIYTVLAPQRSKPRICPWI